MTRFEKVVALRLPADVFRAVRECARRDDRPVGSFLRRLIAANMAPMAPKAEETVDVAR